MRFQKLTIHNIASIEDAVIDFEAQPLADSEVFLITGKTGAGKSTILDAICLALFANTPRLDGTKMQGETRDGSKDITIRDPRQLMRRNTGEAFVSLTFTGSNNVHYEVMWSVARAHTKVDGALQNKKWQLKNLDTDFTLTKDVEIKAEIHAAIGLDFDQFCRTTMLAQGEFTRFLNSRDDEKAEILEKITGVDVYSKIGAKVYEISHRKEQVWKEAMQLVEGIKVLSEAELTERQALLLNYDEQQKQFRIVRDAADAKRQWLRGMVDLTRKEQDAQLACETAQKKRSEDQYIAADRMVRQWNATIEVRGMLRTRNEACRKTNEILPRICENEQQLLQLEARKSPIPLEQMRNQKDQTYQQQLMLQRATSALQRQNDTAWQLQQAREQVKKLSLEVEHLTALTAQEEMLVNEANIRLQTAKTIYEQQREQAHEWARAIRARLHIGDICPLCLQPLHAGLPHEEELSEMYGVAERTYREAEKARETTQQQLGTHQAQLTVQRGTLEHELLRLNNLEQQSQSVNQEVATACQACGVDVHLERLQDHLAQQLANIVGMVKKLTVAITLEEKRVQDAQLIQTSLTADRKLLANNQTTEQEAKMYIDTFLQANNDYSEDLLTQLDRIRHADVEATTARINSINNEILQRQTVLQAIASQKAEHLAKKPEMAEDDTIDAITARIESVEKQLTEIGERRGAVNQELKTDSENRERLGAMIEDADKKKTDYQRWERMESFIGDSNGKKFRKIAQSYVLASLIHSANHYMRTLTDRYTLKVIPGTFVITIEDAYQGFVSRAVSTISGGESFLVSLSLALALSDIGQTLSVDTLFIDEGFGTLSGEPLQNAINTLRTLHTKAGRHVGIISHVEELQERIPVQIQVIQEGNNSSSQIKVIPDLV